MEYLMTYGWAILAVLVIGGVLYYYGIFSPGTLVGESKTGFSMIQVDQWAIDTTNDQLDLVVTNRAGEEVNIQQVKVDQDGDGNYQSTDVSQVLSTGSKEDISGSSIALESGLDAGDSYRMDVRIEFNYTSTGLEKSSSGKLSGTA